MGIAHGKAFALGVFSAAILAEARAERILREAEQFPVAEPAEYTVRRVNVLVHAGHVFIDVSTRAGRLNEILGWGTIGGQGDELQQEGRGGVNAVGRDHIATKRGALTGGRSRTGRVHRERIVDCYPRP